jgi:hypothetical protein
MHECIPLLGTCPGGLFDISALAGRVHELPWAGHVAHMSNYMHHEHF